MNLNDKQKQNSVCHKMFLPIIILFCSADKLWMMIRFIVYKKWYESSINNYAVTCVSNAMVLSYINETMGSVLVSDQHVVSGWGEIYLASILQCFIPCPYDYLYACLDLLEYEALTLAVIHIVVSIEIDSLPRLLLRTLLRFASLVVKVFMIKIKNCRGQILYQQ